MVSIFCVRLLAAFCIWYQKGVLQGVPGTKFGIILSCYIRPSAPALEKGWYQFFKVILENKREYKILSFILLGL